MATEPNMVPLMVKPSQIARFRLAVRRALRPVTGPGVVDGPDGLSINGSGRSASVYNTERPTRMRVKTIGDNNYWGCVLWDGTTEGTKIHNVALPPDLRDDLADWQISEPTLTGLVRDSLDPQTLTASFSDRDDETWKVTRTVGVDHEIWPMRVTGGTGVTAADGEPIHWLLISTTLAFAKDDT